MKFKLVSVASAVAATLLSAIPVVRAEAPADPAQLEEVVVTAERSAESLQKTALTVTALSGEEIEQKGQSTYENILRSVPGVQLQMPPGNDSAAPTIAIRGLGTDGGNKPPSTAVYEDGVIVNALNLQFYDLSRVEILSGPQATLYGGVATSGAVNVITNDPSLQGFSGAGNVGVGSHSLVRVGGMFNIPLSDTTAVRVAFNQEGRSNYVDTSNGVGRRELNARAKLLYQPNDSFSLLLGGEVYRFTGILTDSFSLMDPAGKILEPALPGYGYDYINTNKLYVNLNWNLGWGVLTYLPAAQLSSSNIEAFSPPPATTNVQAPYEDVFTQELRVASVPGSTLKWIAGLYYRHSREEKIVNIGFAPTLPVPNDGPLHFYQTIGLNEFHPFAQMTYPLTDSVRLTGGVSYSVNSEDYPMSGQVFGPTFSNSFKKTYRSFDKLARIEADVAPDSLVYASFSTGFRPGGRSSANGVPFEQEKVRAYEVGSKNRFLNNRLQLNGALYYNDYPNFQNEATTELDGVLFPTTAALPATIYGAELSIVAQLSAVDSLSFEAAFESARYDANVSIPVLSTSDTGELITNYASLETDGAQITHAPRWSLSAGYDHTFQMNSGANLVFSANGHYQTRQPVVFDSCLYLTAACNGETAAQMIQGSYAVGDASLTYNVAGGKYSFTAYAQNVTNEQYKTGDQHGFATVNAPRTFGVNLQAKW